MKKQSEIFFFGGHLVFCAKIALAAWREHCLHVSSPTRRIYKSPMVKYADDIYMIVPASSTSTIPLEMAGVQAWATKNNQALNVAKSA